MIRQVRVNTFRENPDLNSQSEQSYSQGTIFQARSTSSDFLRAIHQSEKSPSSFANYPPLFIPQSQKGLTQLHRQIPGAIKFTDKNSPQRVPSLTGSLNGSPTNYSQQSPSSLIICSKGSNNLSSNSFLTGQIQNNMNQQKQLSGGDINQMQILPQSQGSQILGLVQVAQPVRLLVQPFSQQQSQQYKIMQNQTAQAQQKQIQQKQLLNNGEVQGNLNQKQQLQEQPAQQQPQTHQQQIQQAKRQPQNETLSGNQKVISKDQTKTLAQNDQIIFNIGGKVSDLSTEIQRLLGLNEKLLQEALSWRQKCEVSEMKRQIIEQELFQMKQNQPDKGQDVFQQTSEFSATRRFNMKTISRCQPKNNTQDFIRVRSPSCGSLADSSCHQKLHENQYNFQEIVQQISSLESLKKSTEQLDNQTSILVLEEENLKLKQALELQQKLAKEKQEQDNKELEQQQAKIQKLEGDYTKLTKKLSESENRERKKDEMIVKLEKEKEMKQNLATPTRDGQDISQCISPYKNTTGAVFSCLDKTDIFYHSQHSPKARNVLNKSQGTTLTSTAVNVDQSFLKKIQPNYQAFQSSNKSQHSESSQEYRYHSNISNNMSSNCQNNPNSPVLDYFQIKDVLTKRNNLSTREIEINPQILHQNQSVKAIEYTQNCSQQQQMQVQQQDQLSYQIQQQTQQIQCSKNLNINNKEHETFSFNPELDGGSGNNRSYAKRDKLKNSTLNINLNYCQQQKNNGNSQIKTINKAAGKDNSLADVNIKLNSTLENLNNLKHLKTNLSSSGEAKKVIQLGRHYTDSQEIPTQRYQQMKNQDKDNYLHLIQREAFEENLSDQLRDMGSENSGNSESFCVNYSFSEKENCLSSTKQIDIQLSPQFINQNKESFYGLMKHQ